MQISYFITNKIKSCLKRYIQLKCEKTVFMSHVKFQRHSLTYRFCENKTTEKCFSNSGSSEFDLGKYRLKENSHLNLLLSNCKCNHTRRIFANVQLLKIRSKFYIGDGVPHQTDPPIRACSSRSCPCKPSDRSP